MGMPAAVDPRSRSDELDRVWTADEVRAFPDVPGLRFEVVDGELLVSPGPRLPHQRAAMWLMFRLNDYVALAPRIGEVSFGPGDARLDEYTLVQPDVFVAPLVNGRRPRDRDETTRFLLVIEVLSPSSKRADRIVKRQKYQQSADEYWLVDPPARRIERWRPASDAPDIVTDSITWHPTGRMEPLVLDLPALFREAFGEAP